MATVFDLQAKLGLDSSAFVSGLSAAKKIALGGVTAIGAAAVAFVGKSIQVGAEFDKSMSQVAATMGTTVDQIQDLRDFALEMGSTTKFTASEAADALNYMALAGYDADMSMQMLPTVLNLAAAGNMDLARASDMVTDSQTAFGLSADRTTQMVDEMAKAASTGNTSVEQLGDAFLVVGGLAQELNGGMVELSDGTTAEVDGIQELEIALTAMANAGIKGSEAGTHMRNMLLKLSSPTKEGVEQLEALGVTVFDADGNMRSLNDIFSDLSDSMSGLTQKEKLKAISDLFNTRDTASAEALLAAIGEDWDKIGESILESSGAAKQMADTQLDNLSGDVTKFKSALEGAQIQLADKLNPTLRSFVQWATEKVALLPEIFDKVKEAFKRIYEAISPVIEKIASMVDGEKAAKSASEFLSEAFDVFVTVLGYVAEGIVKVIEFIEKVVEWIKKAIDVIQDIAKKAGDAINSVAQFFTDAWATIQEIWGTVVEFFTGIWEGIKETFATVGSWFKSKFESAKISASHAFAGIKKFMGDHWAGIKEKFASAHTWFQEKFATARALASYAFQKIKADMGDHWSGIKEKFATAHTWFQDKFSTARALASNAFGKVKQDMSDHWESIKTTFSTVGTWFQGKFSTAYSNIQTAFSGWADYWGGLWETIKGKFTNIGGTIANAISGALKGAINGAIGTIESTINSGIGLINGAITFINKLPGVNIGYITGVRLPRLARGGILEKGQVGLLEGTGAEAVVPLENNEGWIRKVAEDMADAIGSGANYDQTVNIYSPTSLNPSEVARQTRLATRNMVLAIRGA